MSNSKFIEANLYKKIIEVLPILTIDLLVFDKFSKKHIQVKRSNPPLKNTFMTPGGRILKGEKSINAAQRKCLEEIGINIPASEWVFVGFFETDFKDSHFDLSCSTHTLSVIFASRLMIDSNLIKLDDQSSDWGLFDSLPEAILNSGHLLPSNSIKSFLHS